MPKRGQRLYGGWPHAKSLGQANRSDVGWYQIRIASGDYVPVDFGTFEAAYKALGDKLRPQVYDFGFLR